MPDAATPLPALLDIAAVAAWLGTSPRHLRRLVAERRIPYVKVGHLIRFIPAEIVAWLDANRPPYSGPNPTGA